VKGFHHNRRTRTQLALDSLRTRHDFWRLSEFDTSQFHVSKLYRKWADEDGVLKREAMHWGLQDYGIMIGEDKLDAALDRMRSYLSYRKLENSDNNPLAKVDDDSISEALFASVWQRLMLGAVCNMAHENNDVTIRDMDMKLIGYDENSIHETKMNEELFMFGGNLRFKSSDPNGSMSSWARIDQAESGRLVRMGVKFFLHPVATDSAINAAEEGMTKIEVYWHQYFISLEVYALLADTTVNFSRHKIGQEPPRVCDYIGRSTMILVATGNPKKGYRDWLVSIVTSGESVKADPLDRFAKGTDAAVKVLDGVMADLKAHGRLREFQADFLLYSIIDRTVNEVTPICHAYAHRLTWLNEQLSTKKLRLPIACVDEVSTMRLEIQELQQWLAAVKGVLRHIEVDCKRKGEDGAGGAAAWNFGTNVRNHGRNLLLFLRGTQDHLERNLEKLRALDELARNFDSKYEQATAGFMNNALFVLTVATAVALPVQFVTGLYGMNFEDMPELKWKLGYLYFWVIVLSILFIGGFTAWYFIIRR
jgi:Mg2+ and Co2+ transporter CorA